MKLTSLFWGRGFHIFKPDAGVSADDPEFPAHVLMEQARYFGPFPLRYKKLLDEESESNLAAIHVLIEQQGSRKPLSLVKDEEILPKDKEFLCDIMQLDPLERPTARELLQHRSKLRRSMYISISYSVMPLRSLRQTIQNRLQKPHTASILALVLNTSFLFPSLLICRNVSHPYPSRLISSRLPAQYSA